MQAERRRRYVCGRDGKVQWDEQRDQAYTVRLSDALVDAYARDADPLPTNVAAYAAWNCLIEAVGSRDPFRIVRSPIDKRRIAPRPLPAGARTVLARMRDGAREGGGATRRSRRRPRRSSRPRSIGSVGTTGAWRWSAGGAESSPRTRSSACTTATG